MDEKGLELPPYLLEPNPLLKMPGSSVMVYSIFSFYSVINNHLSAQVWCKLKRSSNLYLLDIINYLCIRRIENCGLQNPFARNEKILMTLELENSKKNLILKLHCREIFSWQNGCVAAIFANIFFISDKPTCKH